MPTRAYGTRAYGSDTYGVRLYPLRRTYGSYGYGFGPYGPAEPRYGVITEYVRPVVPARHLLGIGPWADGIAWRPWAHGYAAEWAPSRPLLPVPNPTGLTVTLRRAGASEASVTMTQPRATTIPVHAMVTDLWWKRYDTRRDLVESIGRFNASSVDTAMSNERVTLQTTWVDYRGVLEDRLITETYASPIAAGTSIVTLLGDIIPDNALIDTTVLSTVSLGNTTAEVTLQDGSTVEAAIEAVRAAAPAPFDWRVVSGATDAQRPVLQITVGETGVDRGVVLYDTGDGGSPIRAWRCRSDASQYANSILVAGATDSQRVNVVGDDPTLTIAEGQRDFYLPLNEISDPDVLFFRGEQELERRSTKRRSWSIDLVHGFWEGRTHIDVGDSVRVVINLGDDVADERALVEEISIAVNETGAEEVSLTLGPALPSTNPGSRYAPLSRVARAVVNTRRYTTA